MAISGGEEWDAPFQAFALQSEMRAKASGGTLCPLDHKNYAKERRGGCGARILYL